MYFIRHAPIRCLFAAGVAALLGACASSGDDATAALTRSTQGMGSTTLKTLRYAGNGIGFTFGQAYTPGGAWPKITVHSMTRTLDYDSGAMRDEVVISRAEPLGGGGQTANQCVSNEDHLGSPADRTARVRTTLWRSVLPAPRSFPIGGRQAS